MDKARENVLEVWIMKPAEVQAQLDRFFFGISRASVRVLAAESVERQVEVHVVT